MLDAADAFGQAWASRVYGPCHAADFIPFDSLPETWTIHSGSHIFEADNAGKFPETAIRELTIGPGMAETGDAKPALHASDKADHYPLSDASDGSDLNIYGDESFKDALVGCLDDIKREGSFASFNRHRHCINPGLHIKGYGSVRLPLAPRDAKAVSKICKQSPFGKGEEAVVDTSVRKTWELHPSHFECQNPR